MTPEDAEDIIISSAASSSGKKKRHRFVYKTEKPTGRYSSFFSKSHYIKIKKEVCGSIDDAPPHKIRFQVIKDNILEDGNRNCPWKWIILKKESESLQEAKDFLDANIEKIMQKYKLWFGEEKEKCERERLPK